MRAVVVPSFGGPEQLAIAEVPVPALGAGSIDIDVRACALNRADLLQRRGLYPPPPGASDILGLECAGVVRATGAGVAEFAPGDRVMALLAGGGYAERAICPSSHALRIPDGLSFEQAAAIPEAFLTASEALFTTASLGKGETVLIHAAAGGVGSAALQLAKLEGARVIASSSSPQKAEWVRALGADRAVDYRAEDFVTACAEETAGRGVDVILDFIGASHAERHQRCLAEGGRWVVLGLMGGSTASLDLALVLRKRWQVRGLVMRTRSREDKTAIVARFAQRFTGHVASGRLRPMIDRVYPMSEVRAAHERMERNENLGKIVLRVPR
jgi:putative PIG3 family NAD(P)H quinone oxidoreductase